MNPIHVSGSYFAVAEKTYPAKIISTLSNSRAGCILEVQHDMQFCVGDTVWLMREEPKETLYAIHMQGPDDVIAAPSKAAAEAVVKNFNQFWEDHKHERQHDVRVVAVVIEWPYGEIEHARDVLASFGEYADLLMPFTSRLIDGVEHNAFPEVGA